MSVSACVASLEKELVLSSSVFALEVDFDFDLDFEPPILKLMGDSPL